MSPTSPHDAGRMADSATAIAQLATSLAKLATPPPDEDDLLLLDDAEIESALTTNQWQPRPVSEARVGPRRNADSHRFNDPSNYLG